MRPMTMPALCLGGFLLFELLSLSLGQQLIRNLTAELGIYTGDYDISSLPVPDGDNVPTVFVDFAMHHIIDLDEKSQVLHLEGWVRLSWEDSRLAWNRTQYNIKQLQLEPSNIWTPDLFIYNEVGIETGRDETQFRATVKPDGKVQWNYQRVMQTACHLDVADFPFDYQTCDLKFGSWSLSLEFLNVSYKNPQGDKSNYKDNGEWVLLDMPAENMEENFTFSDGTIDKYVTTTFHMKLKRRALYYGFHLLFPCMVICFINVSGFLLPVQSGERISLNVTVLLGLIVFLLLVADLMPPQSTAIPLLGGFVGFCVCLIGVSTFLNIFVLHYYFRQAINMPVPRWMRSLVIHQLGRILCYKNVLDRVGFKDADQVHLSKPIARPMYVERQQLFGMPDPSNYIYDHDYSTSTSLTNSTDDVFTGVVTNTMPTISSLVEKVAPEEPSSPKMYFKDPTLDGQLGEIQLRPKKRRRPRLHPTEQTPDEISVEWNLIVLVLDRFLFTLLFSILIIACLWVIIKGALH